MANTKSIFIAENSTPGTLVPSTTAVDYVETPLTSENITATAQSVESQIIRADRSPAGSIRTGIEVSGSVNAEFMYGAFDRLLEGALLSADWANVNGSGVKVTGATVQLNHGTFSVVATAASPFAGLNPGDWVRFEKSGYANDLVAVRIATWTDASNITYDAWNKLPTTDGSAVTSVVVRAGQEITQGSTDRLFTIAKKIGQGGVTKYPTYLGITLDGFNLSMQPGQVPSISFPMVGSKLVGDDDGDFRVDSDGNEVGSGGTQIQLSTYLASGFTSAPSNTVFSPVNQSSAIMIDGVPSAVATQLNLQLSNQTSGEPVLFRFGNYSTTPGSAQITGSFEALYLDGTLRTKFINETPVHLAFYITDGLNQAYLIDIPSVTLNGGGEQIQGQEGFVRLPFSFSARKDTDLGVSMRIIRFGID